MSETGLNLPQLGPDSYGQAQRWTCDRGAQRLELRAGRRGRARRRRNGLGHLGSKAAVYPPISPRRTIPGHERLSEASGTLSGSGLDPAAAARRFAGRRRRRPHRPGRTGGRSRGAATVAGDAPHLRRRLPQLWRVPRPARHSRRPDGRGGARLSRRARARRRSPATVAKHLSALRGLAGALGVDAQLRTVRSARVGRGEPRALSHDEWMRLLRMPDRRTRQGKRDLALLHLLGSAGLRRAEAANLLVSDVDERRRAGDPRLRQAIKGSTSWWVTVRYGKARPHRRHPARRGRARGDRRVGQEPPPQRPPSTCCSHCPAPATPARSARATSRGSSRATPPPLTCRRTGARRTCCATPSAPTWPTPARTRRDPRARRPRRHPHHHDLHRRQPQPTRERGRRARPAEPWRQARRRWALSCAGNDPRGWTVAMSEDLTGGKGPSPG
jgi:hypothetical protein